MYESLSYAKVREFAESVKCRFVLLRPVHSDKPGTISSSVNQGHQQLPEAIMNEIRQILHQEVDSEVEHRLLPRIERVIAYHCTHSQSRISRAKDDSELDMSQLELPPPSPKGDFVTVSSPQEHSQSRPLGQKDDFQRDKPSYESRPLMQKGNFEAAGDGSESPSFSPKGDFSHIRSPHDASERRLFEDTDASSLEKSHFFDAKDDSHCTETQDTFANVNVLSFRTYINVNVRLVASLCCHALNEPSTKRGIYLKLFRECNLDADAIAGALLYTLVHRQNGTMRKPPAVFMKLCREYHHTGIPHETRHLMQRYGELSYHRLLTEVNQVPAPVVYHAPSLEQGQRGKEYPRVAAAHSPDAALTQAVALSPAHEKPLALHIPLRSDGGMRQDDALQLRAMLAHDRRLGLCRTALIVLEDGSYGVLVDNTITNTIRQVVFYSVQQWQERSLTFKSGHELFTDGSEGKRVLHPLRLWRQHHYPQQEQEA